MKFIRKILFAIISRLPRKNVILFESWPVYADNTAKVFDELVSRGINKKYKLYWVFCSVEEKYQEDYPAIKKKLKAYKNVKCVNQYQASKFGAYIDSIREKYVLNVAKLYVICNHYIPKAHEDQIYINLTHGSPLKDIRNHGYGAPTWVNYIVRLSDIFEENLLEPEKNIAKYITLGYPRNDDLFDEKIDLKRVFPDREFEKIIYWMPTWRQHNRSGKSVTESSSIPIIHDEAKAEQVNKIAKEKGVLIVMKPHFSQDVSRFKKIDLSNIIFIDNDYLSKKNVLNYELLRSVDAMITDYSSVYYDYLLCDKPIGLGWEDFEEFNKNEGFVVDVDEVLSGGEKLYTVEDLNAFVERVANGEDILAENRRMNRDIVHKYNDNNSTKRVVDFIMESLR